MMEVISDVSGAVHEPMLDWDSELARQRDTQGDSMQHLRVVR